VNTLHRDDLDYPLDPERIATAPATPRDGARLLVVGRDGVEHRFVRDLPEYLRPGDLMVVNATVVQPRRLVLQRRSGGLLEALLLEPLGDRRWKALLRGGRRLAESETLTLVDADGRPQGTLCVGGREAEHWTVRLEGEEDEANLLDRAGHTPLPPYILKARRDRASRAADVPTSDRAGEERLDRDRYQTVYADPAAAASVAAPTAGLHFTPELLSRLAAGGVERLGIELQVGPGTFRSVECERLEDHRMDFEGIRVRARDVERLHAQDRHRAGGGGRTLAVGSTSVRTLESLPPSLEEAIAAGSDLEFATDLMLVPGMPVRRCDLLLTNFHLPRSTLIALVAAFVGLDRIKSLYAMAAREGYRFFSYGDAMLVLPEAIIAPR
jgi:S-adenosylmethionine:tRNA ribosyltransferase-isomerase